jgi:hypothetical protein
MSQLQQTPIEYVDRVPADWFVLDVMRSKSRGWDWVALMVDVDPDDLKHCACEFPALFYVYPKEYRFAFLGSTETGMPHVTPSKT